MNASATKIRAFWLRALKTFFESAVPKSSKCDNSSLHQYIFDVIHVMLPTTASLNIAYLPVSRRQPVVSLYSSQKHNIYVSNFVNISRSKPALRQAAAFFYKCLNYFVILSFTRIGFNKLLRLLIRAFVLMQYCAFSANAGPISGRTIVRYDWRQYLKMSNFCKVCDTELAKRRLNMLFCFAD